MSTLDSVLGTEDQETAGHAAQRRVRQLLALNQSAILITGEIELDSLLQRIVDEARKLVGSKYAALGVLGEDGFISKFPTSGVSEAEREQIGKCRDAQNDELSDLSTRRFMRQACDQMESEYRAKWGMNP